MEIKKEDKQKENLAKSEQGVMQDGVEHEQSKKVDISDEDLRLFENACGCEDPVDTDN